MNNSSFAVSSAFYELVMSCTDTDESLALAAGVMLYDAVGSAQFDVIRDSAIRHLAVLWAVQKLKQGDNNDESVTASQEESPVASRDHKE